MTETKLIGRRKRVKLNHHYYSVIYPEKRIPFEEAERKIRNLLTKIQD